MQYRELPFRGVPFEPQPTATSLSSVTCLSPHGVLIVVAGGAAGVGHAPRARALRPSSRQAEANHCRNKEPNHSIPFACQVRWLRPSGGRYCPALPLPVGRGGPPRPRLTPVLSRAVLACCPPAPTSTPRRLHYKRLPSAHLTSHRPPPSLRQPVAVAAPGK